ncbi:MAG: prolipoprotein diacylglyceryl transferase [Gemmatimonadales bacterium]|nr:prolipoprotein diacylglyceryl transferase [Gemmatimonadales bacterium]
MTFHPVVFHLGPFELAGFGLMMMLAFIVAGWLAGAELRRLGFNEAYASDLVVAAVVGGIVGAKLWYVALTGDASALLSRSGLVYYGGFLGGTAAVVLTSWHRRVPLGWTAHLVAAPLALAYAIGRIGCFLANDDYGRPTDLPWGVKFPEGLPPTTAGVLARQFGVAVPPGTDPATVLAVHPTQLYEALVMAAVFAVLWRVRGAARPAGWLFGLYLVLAGLERFGIEILRAKDDRFLGPFTLAQATSAVLVAAGVVLLVRRSRGPSPAPGPWLGAAPVG